MGLNRACVWTSVASAVALALGVLAARGHSLPNLLSFSGQALFREPDFWCVLGSSALAFGAGSVALHAGLVGTSPPRGSVVAAILVWFGLAFFLFVLWAQYVLYYAVLLGPSHALAALGVFLCWQRQWREDERRRFEITSARER